MWLIWKFCKEKKKLIMIKRRAGETILQQFCMEKYTFSFEQFLFNSPHIFAVLLLAPISRPFLPTTRKMQLVKFRIRSEGVALHWRQNSREFYSAKISEQKMKKRTDCHCLGVLCIIGTKTQLQPDMRSG